MNFRNYPCFKSRDDLLPNGLELIIKESENHQMKINEKEASFESISLNDFSIFQ